MPLGWWLSVAVSVVLLWLGVSAQPRTVTLAIGRFGGTDQEILECTFSVGTGAALLLRPKGEPCVLARELVGRTGTLTFVPD